MWRSVEQWQKDKVLAAAATLVCWFAFASGFFCYMDHHGSLPAEPCESKRVDFDEFECRGHYSFENELLVPQLGMAGLFGTAVGLGAVALVRRRRRFGF